VKDCEHEPSMRLEGPGVAFVESWWCPCKKCGELIRVQNPRYEPPAAPPKLRLVK